MLLLQFLGGPNMLTGPTDDYWRCAQASHVSLYLHRSLSTEA